MTLRDLFSKPLSRRVFGLVGFLSFAHWSTSHASIAKPILKCTRIGQTVVYRGRKFTCIRVKGKMVWDDGILITPSPSTSASPNKTAPSPTKSPSPSTPQTPSLEPTPAQSMSPTSATKTFVFAKSSQVPDGKTTIIEGFDPYKRPLSVAFTRTNGRIVSSLEAACTHAGCIVIPEGRELRCPCHGSRFDYLSGEILDKSQQALTPLGEMPCDEKEGSIFLTI